MTATSTTVDVAVIGGGAAGFLAAATCAEQNPGLAVAILEKSAKTLAKVRISGGGRCNVTHACFDPAELVQHYPRGGRELRGPFSRFAPGDTVAWFESRGVPLKTEGDGRMFPKSNTSASIVDALRGAVKKGGVRVMLNSGVNALQQADGGFRLETSRGEVLAKKVLLCPGGSAQGMALAEVLGHELSPPVPSLFTFLCKDVRLKDLAGLSVQDAHLRVEGLNKSNRGPLLITHRGFSGPALITLSAWLARDLAACEYRGELLVNWLGDIGQEAIQNTLKAWRKDHARKPVQEERPWRQVPRRLWVSFCKAAGIGETRRWADLGKDQAQALGVELGEGRYGFSGMNLFKEEFVTCGGVLLKEVDMKTMESRKVPGLYFAGEVLDMDGVTGGFNFQAAWTTGYLAGTAMATKQTSR